MKKYNKYFVGVSIILLCFIVSVFIKRNQHTPLKSNEIKVDGDVIQLTANKSDYSSYKNMDGFYVYDNKDSLDVEIENSNILTYKDIKVGDSTDKLDFCDDIGIIYVYKTEHKYNGYYMEIVYYEDVFDNVISTIKYRIAK